MQVYRQDFEAQFGHFKETSQMCHINPETAQVLTRMHFIGGRRGVSDAAPERFSAFLKGLPCQTAPRTKENKEEEEDEVGQEAFYKENMDVFEKHGWLADPPERGPRRKGGSRSSGDGGGSDDPEPRLFELEEEVADAFDDARNELGDLDDAVVEEGYYDHGYFEVVPVNSREVPGVKECEAFRARPLTDHDSLLVTPVYLSSITGYFYISAHGDRDAETLAR